MKRLFILASCVAVSMCGIATPYNTPFANVYLSAEVHPTGAGTVYIQPYSDDAVELLSVEGEKTECKQTFTGTFIGSGIDDGISAPQRPYIGTRIKASLKITPAEGYFINDITYTYKENGEYYNSDRFKDYNGELMYGLSPGETEAFVDINTFGDVKNIIEKDDLDELGVPSENYAQYVFSQNSYWPETPEVTIHINMGTESSDHEINNCQGGKKLYTAIESAQKDMGEVFLATNFRNRTGYEASTLGSYSELKKQLHKANPIYEAKAYALILGALPFEGYGLRGFVETLKEDGDYEESDFVRDYYGEIAKNNSIVVVDDPNCAVDHSTDSPMSWSYGRKPTEFSETPNRHFYAIFTGNPSVDLQDGVSMEEPPTSPTETYTVTFHRHLNKGWNPICVPCKFNVDNLYEMLPGSKVCAPLSFDKQKSTIFCANVVGGQVLATPIIVYSPEEYDLEMTVIDSKLREVPDYRGANWITASFVNTYVEGKCYSLNAGENGFVIEDNSDNYLPAFRWVITPGGEIPASSKIGIEVIDDDATEVESIFVQSSSQNVYNISGQNVNDYDKGIIIKNGKKVLVK